MLTTCGWSILIQSAKSFRDTRSLVIKPKYSKSKAYGYDYDWFRTFPIKSTLHHFNKALTKKNARHITDNISFL